VIRAALLTVLAVELIIVVFVKSATLVHPPVEWRAVVNASVCCWPFS
jgi:hypothetical protein